MDQREERSFGDLIAGKLLSELEKALKDLDQDAVFCIDSLETLGFKDWLESIDKKIQDIIESSKHMGSKLVVIVLPKIVVALKTAASKGGEAVEKVISAFVGTLKKIGGSGPIKAAIKWIKEKKDQFGDLIAGKLLSELEKALKDLGQDTVLDINSMTAMETLGFKDWLKSIGDKIKEIIESGKEA